jgi:chromate reductase
MLVGSLRRESINLKLARAIEQLAPEHLTFDWVRMDDLPYYNGDLEPDRSAAILRFVDRIAASDGVCMVSPEYNRSIPALLKNAIDWGSKPADRNVWRDRVIAMTGASPGGIGTAVGQQHLRQILAIQGAVVLPGETYVSFKPPELIDMKGNVSDDSVRNFIASFVARFARLIDRHADDEADQMKPGREARLG